MVAEAHVLPGDALDRLEALGLTVRSRGGGRADLGTDGHTLTVRVLTHVRPGMPSDRQIDEARASGLPVLFTAPYVSSRLGSQLRAAGLQYVDAAGNSSIRLPGLFVEVSGRPRVVPARRPATGPAGRRTGLRVLLTLLADPDVAGERTVRDVADAAGVSIGSAQLVLADLRERRFLYDGGLDRTALLFESWLTGYLNARSLQAAKASFGHDREWFAPDAVREAMLELGAVLGGEDAAELLGVSLRGSSGILYSADPPTSVVRAARLRREAAGALEWRERWWRPAQGALTAPTPLIYADLVASQDPRQSEAAAELRRRDELLRRIDAN